MDSRMTGKTSSFVGPVARRPSVKGSKLHLLVVFHRWTSSGGGPTVRVRALLWYAVCSWMRAGAETG